MSLMDRVLVSVIMCGERGVTKREGGVCTIKANCLLNDMGILGRVHTAIYLTI